MSSNGPLFQRSLAALALVKNAGSVADCKSRAGALGSARRYEGGRSTAMSIQFAPEPDPTANILELAQDQTAGPLPLGFEFEFFGVRYDRFCLSSDGFLSFSTRPPSRVGFDPQHEDTSNFIALGWGNVYRQGGKRVAYEVRGSVQRRRLVLSFAPLTIGIGAEVMAAQLVLHERTGMVDVHTTRHDGVAGQVALRLTTSPGNTWQPIDSPAH